MKTLLFLIFALITTSANAMRCQNSGTGRLVQIGDFHYQVIKKCGEPDFFGKIGGVDSDVEIMKYTQGGMDETLTFRKGQLESIESNRQ
jgi:hypothetical protein